MGPVGDIQAEFFAALAGADMPRVAGCLAENVLFLFPRLPPVHGRAATVRALARLRARFADIGWTHVASLDAAPDWRIATWTVVGERVGGAPLAAEVASVMRLDRDGRIAYLSDYFKSRDLGRPAGATALLDAAGRLSTI